MTSILFFLSSSEIEELHHEIFDKWNVNLYPSVIDSPYSKPIQSVEALNDYVTETLYFPYFQMTSKNWTEKIPTYKESRTKDGNVYYEAPLGRCGLSLGFIPSRVIKDRIEPGALMLSSYYFRDVTGWDTITRPPSLIKCYRTLERKIKKGRQITYGQFSNAKGPYASISNTKDNKLYVENEQFCFTTDETLMNHANINFNGWSGWYIHV